MSDASNRLRFTRRSLLPLSGLAAVGAFAATHSRAGGGAGAEGEDADWPSWAPTRRALYAGFAAARSKGRDIRSFGATLDGKTDDTAALEKAIASGVKVLLIPAGALCVTRLIKLSAPITILGAGDASVIRVEGKDTGLFTAAPASGDSADFLRDIHIDSIRVVRPEPHKPLGLILVGNNLRNVSITRCSTDRMGALLVTHLRKVNRKYNKGRKEIVDPAVAAGFHPTRPDDLNEDIFVYDNRVDAGSYMSQVVRFNFARRVAAVGNVGRFAKVSWWGGGARYREGGAPQFMRRVREVYITHNKLSGGNGGVYGNNGDGILVAYNEIDSMTDVGVDFEGCFNALAHHNVVKNVGNFCYVTFYAAKNIVFRDNYGSQDGSGSTLHIRFGKGRYGKPRGRSLLALRSSGFRRNDGSIDVQFLNNHLVWAGERGAGTCTASYFSRMLVQGNRFENVGCDFSYLSTGELQILDNRLVFDKPAGDPVRMLGGGATRTVIRGNEVRVLTPQADGSIGIRARPLGANPTIEVSDNRFILGKGVAPLPIALFAPPKTAARYRVTGNSVGPIYAMAPEQVSASANKDPAGRPVTPAPLPTKYLPKPKEPKEPEAQQPAEEARED